ncbi:galactosylceramide sulfotransferase-like [Xenia sp. Carnegie-2017]|uniref:galactosylceramide sulfotransferase-like n=1 Tax=Xenia sp. Carnegie-2017 TaxID=2897299 RepID=UPI001F03AC4E|nr:galactosylceramide sulfotransferase-like [Xenia sp. Carnegie-2017]
MDWELDDAIEIISNRFHLVLIMEYFDESLVLLKRKMCWKVDDIVYFQLNRQVDSRNQSNPATRDKILQWSKADLMLYKHFNETLWKKIRNEGDSFWNDVSLLRKKNADFRRICLQAGRVVLDRPYPGSNSFIYGHALKSDIPHEHILSCQRMVRSEMTYLNFFKHRLDKT